MTWFRIDDSFHSHPKVDALLDGDHFDAAIALFTLTGCWSAQHLTDGHVPRGRVRRMPVTDPDTAAAELVRVGLWEDAEDGYRFHDWTDWNPSRDKVEEEREKARQRKAEYRAKRGNAGRTATSHDPGDAGRTQLSHRDNPGCLPGTSPMSQDTRPDPTRPVPTKEEVVVAPPSPPTYQPDRRAEYERELRIGFARCFEAQVAEPWPVEHDDVRRVATWLLQYEDRLDPEDRDHKALVAKMLQGFFAAKAGAKRPKLAWLREDPGRYLEAHRDAVDAKRKDRKRRELEERKREQERKAEAEAVPPPPEFAAVLDRFAASFGAMPGSAPIDLAERQRRLREQAERLAAGGDGE